VGGGVWAIVVAAGEGRRFGGPKQFEGMAGRLVLEWSVDTARSTCDGVVLVLPASRVDDVSVHAGCAHVTEGGTTRAESVRAGLAIVPEDAEVIVVHDAARPLASAALFEAVIAAVRAGADGAIPVVPVSDTVKRVEDGRVIATVDRDGLYSVQTPQAFDAAALRRAHADGDDATDDAGLVEAAGGEVIAVAGEIRNRKITDQDDVVLFGRYLEDRHSHASPPS
jgi:2-C-methyl-D-erythritol 4-phosphate cytidylyltransferase